MFNYNPYSNGPLFLALPIIIIYYESLLPHHIRGTVAFHAESEAENWQWENLEHNGTKVISEESDVENI